MTEPVPIREIWELIPGMECLSDRDARRRVLVALRAYIDDSGSGDPPVFLLAGFIAPAENWAAFKPDWQNALSNPQIHQDGKLRHLEYFKSTEANGLSRQFEGWTKDTRDKRVIDLIHVVKKHAITGIYTGVMHADYDAVMRANPAWPFKSPYFFAYYCLMAATLKFLVKSGIDEKVDFIFDEQPGQSDKVQAAYESFMEVATPEQRRRIGNRPIHRSDKESDFTPLQAADLLAWHVRRWFWEKSRGNVFDTPSMQALKTIPQLEDGWSLNRLQNYMDAWRKSFNDAAAASELPS